MSPLLAVLQLRLPTIEGQVPKSPVQLQPYHNLRDIRQQEGVDHSLMCVHLNFGLGSSEFLALQQLARSCPQEAG